MKRSRRVEKIERRDGWIATTTVTPTDAVLPDDCWIKALESVVRRSILGTARALESRCTELGARRRGRDHFYEILRSQHGHWIYTDPKDRLRRHPDETTEAKSVVAAGLRSAVVLSRVNRRFRNLVRRSDVWRLIALVNDTFAAITSFPILCRAADKSTWSSDCYRFALEYNFAKKKNLRGPFKTTRPSKSTRYDRLMWRDSAVDRWRVLWVDPLAHLEECAKTAPYEKSIVASRSKRGQLHVLIGGLSRRTIDDAPAYEVRANSAYEIQKKLAMTRKNASNRLSVAMRNFQRKPSGEKRV